jgi:hypothetical protein
MDCTVLARCVFRGNQWDAIALEACDPGQGLYCNANEQRCSSSPGIVVVVASTCMLLQLKY